MPNRLYFEDFSPGWQRTCGPYHVSREEIIRFAREFDPQPFHLDEAAGKASMLGGLAASGWHSCAIGMRLICDGFMLDSASLGAPGVEEVKWLRPVIAGDALTMDCRCLEAVPSQSKPHMGRVRFAFDMKRQTGESVMSQLNWVLFARRAAA